MAKEDKNFENREPSDLVGVCSQEALEQMMQGAIEHRRQVEERYGAESRACSLIPPIGQNMLSIYYETETGEGIYEHFSGVGNMFRYRTRIEELQPLFDEGKIKNVSLAISKFSMEVRPAKPNLKPNLYGTFVD